MNTKTTPKDFFLHLGATVALYVAVGALINLWFTVINYYFPDALAGYFYGNAVAWPISMLIVLVPIFYVLEWLIARDAAKTPEKNDLWIRRWRMYLTLFLVVILIGGDLITLINTYLNGEITARLVWKVVAILLIAGCVGKYYLFSIYSSHRFAKMARRFNAWAGIVLVLAAIVIGFIAVGSPAKQRALRFDSQRVNDLQSIQWQIINYWQQKGKLPAQLSDMKDDISGFIVPLDPETNEPYQYNRAVSGTKDSTSTGDLSFQLCATFSRESLDTKGRGNYYGSGGYYATDIAMPVAYPGVRTNDVWGHESGLVCFDRTIDPDKYPVNPKLLRD
jgi:hypothetical protein